MTNITNLNLSPGKTPLEPDELAQLIPNLATKGELDQWERKNIVEAHEWALNPRRVRPAIHLPSLIFVNFTEECSIAPGNGLVLIGTRRKTSESSGMKSENESPHSLETLVIGSITRPSRDRNPFSSRVGWRYPPIPERKRKTCSPSRRCHCGETRKARIYMGPEQHRGNWPYA
jgi:hypothetical protein